MRHTTITLSVVFLFQVFAFSQDEKPNLSGIWRRTPEKGPEQDMQLKIEQTGSDITIIFRTHNEENTSRLRIGSDDNKNQIHGAPMVSQAAWDGAALVVHSVAKFGSDELRMDDRWTLSDDKQTLTFKERHHFGAEPQPTDVTYVFRREADGAWEPPQPPQTAEQVYKNIQVMKGVPAPRLMSVMTLFTKWLGVQCNYCHVPNEFEKDDKPAKTTARKMLNMVHQINDANFADNRIVSCWMCHRGNPKPEAFPQ